MGTPCHKGARISSDYLTPGSWWQNIFCAIRTGPVKSKRRKEGASRSRFCHALRFIIPFELWRVTKTGWSQRNLWRHSWLWQRLRQSWAKQYHLLALSDLRFKSSHESQGNYQDILLPTNIRDPWENVFIAHSLSKWEHTITISVGSTS